jgi:transcriptional regulator with XRE-family HTH domain
MLNLDQSPRTPSELRAALEARGMEQQHLATVIGISERTIRRWCDCRAGDKPLRPTWRALIAMGLQAFDAMPRPEPEPEQEPEASAPEPASLSAPPRNRKRRFIPSGPIKPIYKTG